jgi:hypothetical protein
MRSVGLWGMRLLINDGFQNHRDLQRVFCYFRFLIENGTAKRQAIIRLTTACVINTPSGLVAPVR